MAAGGLQRETLEAEAMATLFPFGAAANVAQLAGLDAVRLITLIATAANNARMHKKNCRQFAKHLKLIGTAFLSPVWYHKTWRKLTEGSFDAV